MKTIAIQRLLALAAGACLFPPGPTAAVPASGGPKTPAQRHAEPKPSANPKLRVRKPRCAARWSSKEPGPGASTSARAEASPCGWGYGGEEAHSGRCRPPAAEVPLPLLQSGGPVLPRPRLCRLLFGHPPGRIQVHPFGGELGGGGAERGCPPAPPVATSAWEATPGPPRVRTSGIVASHELSHA